MKPVIALVFAVAALGYYVRSQWPDPVEELPIPTGKVQLMPGGAGCGILLQGDPNGLSLWYRIDDRPQPTPRQLAKDGEQLFTVPR
jgi:hypothetical protein